MKSCTERNTTEERGKREGDERPFPFLYHSVFTQSSIFVSLDSLLFNKMKVPLLLLALPVIC